VDVITQELGRQHGVSRDNHGFFHVNLSTRSVSFISSFAVCKTQTAHGALSFATSRQLLTARVSRWQGSRSCAASPKHTHSAMRKHRQCSSMCLAGRRTLSAKIDTIDARNVFNVFGAVSGDRAANAAKLGCIFIRADHR
jgi:hypothetical protein